MDDILSVQNIINSIIAGIVTSIIIWLYFIIRNYKIRFENQKLLFSNLFRFLVNLNILNVSDKFLFPIMEKVQERIDTFKNHEKIDYIRLFEDTISYLKVLKYKNEWLEGRIQESTNFLENTDISLINSNIRKKVIDLSGDALSLKAYEFNNSSIIELENEFEVIKRTVYSNNEQLNSDLNLLRNKKSKITETHEEKNHEIIKKIDDKIDEIITKHYNDLREYLLPIYSMAQNIIYDFRIISAARKKSMLEIKENIKEIFKLFPNKIQRELNELTNKDMSEHLDLVTSDPKLNERKDVLKGLISDIIDR